MIKTIGYGGDTTNVLFWSASRYRITAQEILTQTWSYEEWNTYQIQFVLNAWTQSSTNDITPLVFDAILTYDSQIKP
jgi:hypothetical protein